MSFAMSFKKKLFDVFIAYKFSRFSNFLFLLMNIVHGTQMLEEFLARCWVGDRSLLLRICFFFFLG
jgi:hypothetical protein